MIQTRLNPQRSAPLWAVLGAPLVGIPLMVLLLAVTAPKDTGSVTPFGTVADEWIDARALEAAADAATECVEELLLPS